MRVANRKQATGHIDGNPQQRASGQLFDIDVAAGLVGCDRPHGAAGQPTVSRNRTGRFGQQHHAAAAGQVGLPAVDDLQQLVRGRKAHHPHERRARDADAGQILRRGHAVGNRPAHDVGLGKHIAQKPKADRLDGEAEGLRLNVVYRHLEQVAGLGAVDKDRSGQRMDQIQADPAHVFDPRVGLQLAIEGVAGFQADHLTGLDRGYRRNVGMPTVMAGVGLLTERPGPVNRNIDIGCWGHTLSPFGKEETCQHAQVLGGHVASFWDVLPS